MIFVVDAACAQKPCLYMASVNGPIISESSESSFNPYITIKNLTLYDGTNEYDTLQQDYKCEYDQLNFRFYAYIKIKK